MFCDNTKGVSKTAVGEGDFDYRISNLVTVGGCVLPHVTEACVWVFDFCMAAKDDPAEDDQEDHEDDLDEAQKVLQPQGPLCAYGDTEGGEGECANGYSSIVPDLDLLFHCGKDVLSKSQGAGGGVGQDDGHCCVDGRDQEFGFRVGLFQVGDVTAVPLRVVACKLNVDIDGKQREEEAQEPEHVCGADGAHRLENAAGSAEDPCADDSLEDEHHHAERPDGVAQRVGLLHGGSLVVVGVMAVVEI